MAADPSQIEHEGVIQEVREDIIRVSVTPVSACASCEAKGACFIHEGTGERIIDVEHDGTAHAVGERVVVTMAREQGLRALVLGYLLPFVLVVLTLVVGMQALNNEVVAGLLSIGVLIPYYTGLYMFRRSIKRSFVFHIKQQV